MKDVTVKSKWGGEQFKSGYPKTFVVEMPKLYNREDYVARVAEWRREMAELVGSHVRLKRELKRKPWNTRIRIYEMEAIRAHLKALGKAHHEKVKASKEAEKQAA